MKSVHIKFTPKLQNSWDLVEDIFMSKFYDEPDAAIYTQSHSLSPIWLCINSCGPIYLRTISLMCHFVKMFLKVIHRRVYKLCKNQMSNTQFGFRASVGTIQTLFGIQVLFQGSRYVNCDVYACFIDYQVIW